MPTSASRSTAHTGSARWRAALAAVLVVVAALLTAPLAIAATAEQRGARLLEQVQSGQVGCASLSSADSESIGEYVMGRMLGSTATHRAMDRQMTAAMGAAGERQAHNYMGRRFSGCATGPAPSSFGAMMGMMGAGMTGSAAGGSQPTMRSGSGMMGFGGASPAGDNDGWSGADTVIVALLALLLALAATGLILWHPWRRGDDGSPLDTLKERFARGEIDREEYDRRRHALEGQS